MRLFCVLVAFTSCLLSPISLHSAMASKNAKSKFNGDFEFADENESKSVKTGSKKRWTHDPNNELCRPLNCHISEICFLEDKFTAICISRKELLNSRIVVLSKLRPQQRKMQTDVSVGRQGNDAFIDSEDDGDDQVESKCKVCPVLKPIFLCGNDNRTYSSLCRLQYHNCLHDTSVRVNCTGFCPCKHSDAHLHSKKLQFQRQKSLLQKKKDSYGTSLTPQSINFENLHYQYLKYLKRSKNLNDLKYDDKDIMNNKVTEKTILPVTWTNTPQSKGRIDCPSSSRPAMANRLLDWFSVIMADSRIRLQHPKSQGHFSIGCQSEVRWMFGHLDTDRDGIISLSEFYGLDNDQNEPCLKPFLHACDIDRNTFLSGIEWCGCFSNAERPCAAVRRRSLPEVAPNCDTWGYYQSIQCHRGLDLCWCVDKHGIEFANTLVRGSTPDCDSILSKINNAYLKMNSVNLDDEDATQDFEGSADLSLDF